MLVSVSAMRWGETSASMLSPIGRWWFRRPPAEGGTWAGAVENLRHNWTPLFVRDGDNVPAAIDDFLRWEDLHLRGSFGDVRIPAAEILESVQMSANGFELEPDEFVHNSGFNMQMVTCGNPWNGTACPQNETSEVMFAVNKLPLSSNESG